MHLRHSHFALLPIALSLVLGACSDDEGSSADVPDEAPSESWVLGIYMAADNNLDPAASNDLIELIQTGPPENVEVLIFIDRTEPDKYRVSDVPGMESFSESRLYRLDSENVFEMAEAYGELDSMSIDVIHDFIETVATTQADRRAIVFWDHGSPRSYGSDETPGSGGVSVSALARAFQEDPDAADSESYHFDIIGFDTCLLSSADAIGTLSHLTDIYVASAELEPGDGWEYDGIMRTMYDEDLTPELLAAGMVDAFDTYYEENPRRAGGLDVTLGAFRTDLEDYDAALTAFDEALETRLEEDPDEVYNRMRSAVARSHPYWDSSGSGRSRYIDYGNLVFEIEDLSTTDELALRAQAVLDELRALRIAYSSDDDLPDTLGLSFTVDPALLSDDSRSGDTMQPGNLDDLLTGGEGSIEALIADLDEESPDIDISISGTGENLGVTTVIIDWTASDDTSIDSVTIMTGVEQEDGTIWVGVAKDQNGAVGQLSISGQQEIGLAAAGLTGGDDPALEDTGVAYFVLDRLYIPVAWRDADGSGTALLIADEALAIQGIAVESEQNTWSVINWEDLADHPFELAPQQAIFDPSTNEVTFTTGNFEDAANVRVDPVALEGDDIVAVGWVEDLTESSASQSVPVN